MYSNASTALPEVRPGSLIGTPLGAEARTRMDIERSLEFVLERQVRTEGRVDGLDRKVARLDRRVDGLTKLMKVGMKILDRVQRTQEVHGKLLSEHSKMLAEHSKDLADLKRDVAKILKRLDNDRGNGHRGKNGKNGR